MRFAQKRSVSVPKNVNDFLLLNLGCCKCARTRFQWQKVWWYCACAPWREHWPRPYQSTAKQRHYHRRNTSRNCYTI